MPTESQLARLRSLLVDFRALIAEEAAWQAAVKAHRELPATTRVFGDRSE